MQDPVCGMTVEPHSATGTYTYKGMTYAFCSPHCLEKFRANPAQYVVSAHDTHEGAPVAGTVYTCPMHPEVRQDGPGTCPICGMALEPQTVSLEEVASPELVDMTHRFWISLLLTVPLLLLAMSEMLPGRPVQYALPARLLTWVQLVFATPVVLWGGWPFFTRGWTSLVNRSLNMFTLIAIGTGTAYVYSVIATLVPGLFPDSFRTHSGEVAVYFEAAGVCAWQVREVPRQTGGVMSRTQRFAYLLAQPVYHTQHGTDALEIMAQTQVLIGGMLIVVMIRQRYADERHAERLRQLR